MKKLSGFAVLCASLMVFGWGAGKIIIGTVYDESGLSHRGHKEAGSGLVPPAIDLYELVAISDVILIGTIDSVADQGEYVGYDESDDLIPFATSTPPSASGTPTPVPLFSLPYADFVVSVQTLLKNDGGSGDRTVRMITDGPKPKATACAPSGVEFPSGDIDETYLFFLNKNPDDTYGLYRGPYARIKLGQEITYSDCDETAVEFATGMDEDDFVSAVETQIAGPTRTPTITPTPTLTRTPTATRTPTPTPCSGLGC